MNTADRRALPTRRNHLLSLIALSSLLLLPFINKPFHIDDPLYVWTAQQIRVHPFDFHGFHLNWQGHDEPVSNFFENPPLASYLLASVSLVFGFNRIAFHLIFFLFNVLSVTGTYLLAAQFCQRPFLAALLVLLCPAFLVSATGVMCEPLMFCFWIWAVYFWIRGSNRNCKWLLMAGVIASAAVVTKFLALCAVPLLILYSATHPATARRRIYQALSLLMPLVAAVGYEICTSHFYGIGGFSGATRYVAVYHDKISPSVTVKLINTLCFLGGCAAGCVCMLPLVFRRSVTFAVAVILVIVTAVTATHFLAPIDWNSTTATNSPVKQQSLQAGIAYFGQLTFLLAGGTAISALAITRLHRRIKNADEIFLFLWGAGIFIFTCFINWSINARSLLPLIPPVCILVVRALDCVPTLPTKTTAILLSCGAALSFSVTFSDYRLACTIEQAAIQLPGIARQDLSAGHSLWFTGHWGFQYYIEQSSARPVDDISPKFIPGDLVIYPASSYGGTPGGGGYQFIRRVTVGSQTWASTAHPNIGAEFYCSYGYGLPFVFGPVPIEAFDIVRVTSQTRVHP